MADWVTISSLATAGGTLVLAVATFSSVRSANRSARVAELSLLTGLRPVLTPSREDDPVQHVRFGNGVVVLPAGHGGVAIEHHGQIFLAVSVRNGGSGLGVIHGWRARSREPGGERPPLEEFRRQQIDIYVPAGDLGYWFGRLPGPEDEGYEEVHAALSEGDPQPIQVDLLYGDHEGGQRTVARFMLSEWPQDDEPTPVPGSRRATVLRYWNIDRADPR